MTQTRTKTIMIVDDEPENLNVLESMLREEGGYDVVAFPSGVMALSVLEHETPDLILLDICMPEIDGYEVCRTLKSRRAAANIPVLFLSALTDPEDKVKAFDVGAVDYVTKPLHEAEVLARVRTHLKLRAFQLDMEEQVRQGAVQLAEAHRRLGVWDDAKSQWLSVLSHEIRTPLTGLFGVGDYVFDELPADSKLRVFKDDYEHARQRMLKLVDDACLLSSINVDSSSFRMSAVRVHTAIQGALDELEGSHAEFVILPSAEIAQKVRVLANSNLFFRACADLLGVATMCVEAGQQVCIDTVVHQGKVSISFITSGPSLSKESLDSFFEVGGQRTLVVPGGDFGLRNALASHIVRLFKGSVSVRNGKSGGIVLEAVFPVLEEGTGADEWALLDQA
ncbi:MAG: hybrid sensor histidine kinase/response regulator [Pontiellaceae bacterium]|nr:hybrid sensor histidine kinase/response regulator [Pontiellaceae bacterium]MBN2785029.1 hybrid sensor histidine kinase/response regulator [Pontiellaceae bacterium]